jgi:hypothetical protein
MEVSINGGTLIAGWLIWKSPIQMDADWGYPHDFGNLHIWNSMDISTINIQINHP